MAEKFLELNTSGKMQENEALQSSAGAADAGKIVGLNADGDIDPTMMPPGVGPDVTNMVTSENLASGDYVNIYDNGGVTTARLADNSNSRPAHGYVTASSTSPATNDVFFEGANPNLSGLTRGARVYLDTVGGVTETVPTGAGVIFQLLGVAISPTEVNTDIQDCIVRA